MVISQWKNFSHNFTQTKTASSCKPCWVVVKVLLIIYYYRGTSFLSHIIVVIHNIHQILVRSESKVHTPVWNFFPTRFYQTCFIVCFNEHQKCINTESLLIISSMPFLLSQQSKGTTGGDWGFGWREYPKLTNLLNSGDLSPSSSFTGKGCTPSPPFIGGGSIPMSSSPFPLLKKMLKIPIKY